MNSGLWLIIPAAGGGNRFNHALPKQYFRFEDKTVLEYTLQVFLSFKNIQKIIISLSGSDTTYAQLSLCKDRIHSVIGGNTRSQSVLNALIYLKQHANPQDWVLVHDAARCCLHPTDLQALIHTLNEDKVGGLLAIPVVDSLKLVQKGRVSRSVVRTSLWQSLTPQMFRMQVLFDALMHCFNHNIEISDEAQAIEEIGLSAKIVPAKYPNPKLTYAHDLPLMKLLLQQRSEENCT